VFAQTDTQTDRQTDTRLYRQTPLKHNTYFASSMPGTRVA